MTVSRAPLLIGLSAAVLAAGCGGGSSDSGKVEKTVQTAFADLASGNGQGFCSLTTPAGQKSLAQNLPGASCAKVLNLVSAHLSTQQKNGLRHAKVKSVTVKGNTATVKNSDITTSSGSLSGVLGSSTAKTTLTKQSDGSWKLSG
ncbi:MAG: hypothetical protein WAK93_16805 [Solirubrobacteraceae bacterium]